MISHFSKRGGNALAIPSSDGPLNLAIMWSDAKDDARIIAAATRVIDKCVEVAKGMGLDYRYIYQNYANLNQDVLGGYGLPNRERLLEVARKYDPERVFERLYPGCSKLSGVNGGAQA